MTPQEHYEAAERLVDCALDSTGPDIEGGYDDTIPPTAEELDIRQHVMDGARKDAALLLAAAQVHATLALLGAQRTPVDPTRDPDPELCAGPVQIDGVEGWSCGRGLALTKEGKTNDC